MLLTLIEKIAAGYFACVPRRKPQAKDVDKACVIAHRGVHDNAHGIFENTLAAFRLAQEVGCWGIEFDVRATADGILVVNHDDTLNRLWGYHVAIANLSFSELRSLEPRIPSLAEVVAEHSANMHLFIELKAPFQDEETLVQILQGLSPGKDYHVLALDSSIFSFLSLIPKHVLLLVAVHNNVKKFCNLSLNEHYGGVLGNYLLLTNKHIKKLKEASQVAGVGFVSSKYSVYRELNRGIPWLFTNCSEDVSGYLRQLRKV